MLLRLSTSKAGRWRLRRASQVLASSMLIGAYATGPAYADDRDPGPLPDRGTHTYCLGDFAPPNNLVEERIHWSMGTLASQTIVGVDHHSGGCTPQSDVRWTQEPLGTGVFGAASCIDKNAEGRCDQARAKIHYGAIQDEASNPPAMVRKTACHELGHTVGVQHYDGPGGIIPNPDAGVTQSCMRSGIHDSGSVDYRTYGPHHISDHINWWWSQP